MNVPLNFISKKYLGPPTQFQRSHPSDSDHTQSQLSKSIGYGKHVISKSIYIEDFKYVRLACLEKLVHKVITLLFSRKHFEITLYNNA